MKRAVDGEIILIFNITGEDPGWGQEQAPMMPRERKGRGLANNSQWTLNTRPSPPGSLWLTGGSAIFWARVLLAPFSCTQLGDLPTLTGSQNLFNCCLPKCLWSSTAPKIMALPLKRGPCFGSFLALRVSTGSGRIHRMGLTITCLLLLLETV